MDPQESLARASTTVHRHAERGDVRFIRSFGRIVGIWVREFPDDIRREDFLSVFCEIEGKDGGVRRILDGAYTVTASSSGEGYDVTFT